MGTDAALTTAPTTTPKPKRRWLQFSLRTMLVLVLVVSVPLGWFAREVQRVRVQRKAATAIQELGGSVRYSPVSSAGVRAAVVSLGKLFGADMSRVVTGVVLNGTQISDAGLAHLQGLPQLRTLFLDNTQVSDAGLAHLRGLPQLKGLRLASTKISDTGLVHLRGLTQLGGLDLANTQISDAGLKHLRGLTRLRILWLAKPQVTDAGVAQLQKALPNCRIKR